MLSDVPYWFCVSVFSHRLLHQLNCIHLGGNLASIHNGNEYNWIRGIVRRASGSDVWAWIGLSDAIQVSLHLKTTDKSVTCSQCSCSAISFLFQEGKWLWTDGSRFVFSHWAHGQPDNTAGTEHCTHINFGGTNIISKPNGIFNWEETWIKTVLIFSSFVC